MHLENKESIVEIEGWNKGIFVSIINADNENQRTSFRIRDEDLFEVYNNIINGIGFSKRFICDASSIALISYSNNKLTIESSSRFERVWRIWGIFFGGYESYTWRTSNEFNENELVNFVQILKSEWDKF